MTFTSTEAMWIIILSHAAANAVSYFILRAKIGRIITKIDRGAERDRAAA